MAERRRHRALRMDGSDMKYITWLWNNSRGIRWNTAVRIVIGIGRVWLGLMMVWLSRRFIDETIRTGSTEDVLRMVFWLVLTVVGGVLLRQLGYWLTTTASIRQTNALRLRIFSSLFRRQLFTEKELHSGDVTSRLSKDIEQVGRPGHLCDGLHDHLHDGSRRFNHGRYRVRHIHIRHRKGGHRKDQGSITYPLGARSGVPDLLHHQLRRDPQRMAEVKPVRNR